LTAINHDYCDICMTPDAEMFGNNEGTENSEVTDINRLGSLLGRQA
jgi:hypothetical protein